MLRCTTFRRLNRTTASRRTVGGRKSPCHHFFVALAARAAARFRDHTTPPGHSPYTGTTLGRAHRPGRCPGCSPIQRAHHLRPGRSPYNRAHGGAPPRPPGLLARTEEPYAGPGAPGHARAVAHTARAPVGPVATAARPGAGSARWITGVASGRAPRLSYSAVSSGTPSTETSMGISIISPSWCSSTRARSETKSLRSAVSSV